MLAEMGARPAYRWPTSATVLNLAMGGFGTWASAWLCDEASGNISDSIGSVTLSQGNSPSYRNPGAISGSIPDYAVGFDLDQNDNFLAGAAGTYDLDDVTSLALYICLRSTAASALKGLGGKLAVAQPYWYLQCANASGHLQFAISDGTDTATPVIAANHCDSNYHDLLAIIDRTANVVQLISNLGTSSADSLASVGTLSNTDRFRIGGHELDSSLGHRVAYAAVATGDIVNLRANASAAIANLRKFTGR